MRAWESKPDPDSRPKNQGLTKKNSRGEKIVKALLFSRTLYSSGTIIQIEGGKDVPLSKQCSLVFDSHNLGDVVKIPFCQLQLKRVFLGNNTLVSNLNKKVEKKSFVTRSKV